jgi:hypothetical protein
MLALVEGILSPWPQVFVHCFGNEAHLSWVTASRYIGSLRGVPGASERGGSSDFSLSVTFFPKKTPSRHLPFTFGSWLQPKIYRFIDCEVKCGGESDAPHSLNSDWPLSIPSLRFFCLRSHFGISHNVVSQDQHTATSTAKSPTCLNERCSRNTTLQSSIPPRSLGLLNTYDQLAPKPSQCD